jgi:hypothetical protein
VNNRISFSFGDLIVAVRENALDSIRVKREFDSNVIDESEQQDDKHHDPRVPTLPGIQID